MVSFTALQINCDKKQKMQFTFSIKTERIPRVFDSPGNGDKINKWLGVVDDFRTFLVSLQDPVSDVSALLFSGR
jgi:hypothetical protein